jgi:hypothetical protein
MAFQESFFCFPGFVKNPLEKPFNHAIAEEKERIRKTESANQLNK